MNIDFGVGITIAAFALFYIRLYILRQQKRRELREIALQVKRQGKGAKMPISEENRPGYEIKSWVLVVLAAVLMVLGMAARQYTSFPLWAQEYWWVGTTLGAILLAFCFK
ncbi:MAG: hypothetical protein ACYC6H_07565 [Bellilinea sp.]